MVSLGSNGRRTVCSVHVLVVEDERRIATGLKRGLEADGFSVDVAFTGDDGLWYATEHRYDVIVLDLMLPGMNGFEVCRSLRDGGNWTPILVLTAKEGLFDESEALDTGADDYLRKPFSYPVLVSRLRALIRRSGKEASADPTLTLGDLRLDPIAQRAWRQDIELELSPKALTVLQILMRRNGELITKTDLLETGWGFDYEGDPNIVEAYISRLRRAIDKPFDLDTIRTVRGAGYRLTAHGGPGSDNPGHPA